MLFASFLRVYSEITQTTPAEVLQLPMLCTYFDDIFKEQCLSAIRDKSISFWRGSGFDRGFWIIFRDLPLFCSVSQQVN